MEKTLLICGCSYQMGLEFLGLLVLEPMKLETLRESYGFGCRTRTHQMRTSSPGLNTMQGQAFKMSPQSMSSHMITRYFLRTSWILLMFLYHMIEQIFTPNERMHRHCCLRWPSVVAGVSQDPGANQSLQLWLISYVLKLLAFFKIAMSTSTRMAPNSMSRLSSYAGLPGKANPWSSYGLDRHWGPLLSDCFQPGSSIRIFARSSNKTWASCHHRTKSSGRRRHQREGCTSTSSLAILGLPSTGGGRIR